MVNNKIIDLYYNTIQKILLFGAGNNWQEKHLYLAYGEFFQLGNLLSDENIKMLIIAKCIKKFNKRYNTNYTFATISIIWDELKEQL